MSFPRLEAFANIRASKAQALIQMSLALVVGAAVISLPAMDCRSLILEWSKQEAAGRSTYVVTAVSSSLSASLCDAAGRIEGVRGAGAVLQRYPATTSLGSTSKIDVVRVTPGYLLAAWNEVAPIAWSAAAPVDLAHRFGLVPGSTFLTATRATGGGETSRVTVDWVPSQRSRVAGINDSIIEASPAIGTASECLITANPGQRDSVRVAISGWFGKGYRVAPFLQPSALVANPDVAFAARPSQWIALVAPLMVVGVRGVFLFSRRGELALYRTLGMKFSEVARMISTEFLLIVLLPFQAGAFVGLIAAIGLSKEGMLAVSNDYLRALSLLAIGACAALLLISRRSTFDQVRGR